MDTAALRAFVAVARAGSFTGAAKALFLTQPAISKRISTLEEQLQAPLFDRVGRDIHLTEAGRLLLGKAQQLLADMDAAQDEIRSLGEAVRGRLRIATSHHIGIHRLPTILRAFTRDYPEVELDLSFTDSELAAGDVREGSVELAVVTLPLQPPRGLHLEPIWDDPLVLTCHREHPLASSMQISAANLVRHPAVLPAHGTITRDVLERFLNDAGVTPKITLETNYLETIKVMVAVGLGWSVLPSAMIGADLHVLPVEHWQLSRQLGIVRQENRTASRAATQFLRTLRQLSGSCATP